MFWGLPKNFTNLIKTQKRETLEIQNKHELEEQVKVFNVVSQKCREEVLHTQMLCSLRNLISFYLNKITWKNIKKKQFKKALMVEMANNRVKYPIGHLMGPPNLCVGHSKWYVSVVDFESPPHANLDHYPTLHTVRHNLNLPAAGSPLLLAILHPHLFGKIPFSIFHILFAHNLTSKVILDDPFGDGLVNKESLDK